MFPYFTVQTSIHSLLQQHNTEESHIFKQYNKNLLNKQLTCILSALAIKAAYK